MNNSALHQKNIKIIMIGAGSHANVIKNLIELNNLRIHGYISPEETALSETLLYLGNDEEIEKFSIEENVRFIVAFSFYNKTTHHNYRNFLLHYQKKIKFLKALIHPSVIMEDDVEIGDGSVICAGAIIGTRTKIGDNCVINSGAIIDHDCKIHAGCHVAPRATVCGGVVVEKFSLIGAGSVILNNLTIAEDKIISANSCYKGFEN